MATESTLRWQEGEVVETADAADGVRRIVIRPERPVRAAPGAHLDLDLDLGGRRLRRSYSIVRAAPDGSTWTISVQLARSSRGGSRTMHALQPGDRIRVSEPLQDFPLGVGAGRYVLVAGGIGVTALVSMAAALKRRGADYALVLVGRSRAVMAYLDELVEEHGDRVRVHVDDEGTALEVSTLVSTIATSDRATDTELYMCGPIRLMDAVRRAWVDEGLPGPNLRFETFGSSGSWDPETFTVSIPALDRTVTVGEDTSMLDALEDAGLEVMSDCRKGECGLCTLRVLECDGDIDHRDVFLSEEERASGRQVCACVSRVAFGQGTATGVPTLTVGVP